MSKAKPYIFIMHHAKHNARSSDYGKLIVEIRTPGKWKETTLCIEWQSNPDQPEVWYGMSTELKGSSLKDCATMAQRVAKLLPGRYSPGAVCAALESIASEAQWSEAESGYVPTKDLPAVGTQTWMDRGADNGDGRGAYCTVHVQAVDTESAQRAVLQALAKDYPDRVETWISNGKRVEHIRTQPDRKPFWREIPGVVAPSEAVA